MEALSGSLKSHAGRRKGLGNSRPLPPSFFLLTVGKTPLKPAVFASSKKATAGTHARLEDNTLAAQLVGLLVVRLHRIRRGSHRPGFGASVE